MVKKVNILLNKKSIDVFFSDILKGHLVHCEYIQLNQYQLIMKKFTIENIKNKPISLTSTELRNLNMHTLNKRSINLINSFINLDKTSATKKLGFVYSTDENVKKIIRQLHKTNKTLPRGKFLSYFSYLYVSICLSYETNITAMLSDLTGYKQSYIKNLIKECFSNKYLKSSTKGVPGGTLSVKTINYLKQSHLI